MGVTFFVIFVYIIKLVIHVVLINTEIEALFQQKEREIKYEKSIPGCTISGFESKKQAINEKYSEKIEPLLRKKGYILDVLPFLYKK